MNEPDRFERPTLTDLQQTLVTSMRRDGLAVTRFPDLFGDELWNEVRADIQPFVREQEAELRGSARRPMKKDEFIQRRYLRMKPKVRFGLENPWFRIGVSEPMLGIVNSYRGQYTRLHYVDNWFTVPYPHAEQRIASQLWHRDPEEDHVVKVFLYLSEVDEDAGPFEYMKGSPAGGRYGDLYPWGCGVKRPPEEDIEQAVDPQDHVVVTGAAGTMFFCDTGGFHRGGFARAHPRVLAMWSYVSPAAGKGHRFEVDLEGREAELPAEALAALA
jgi:hypothetical protein